MSLNIKNEHVHELAREAARRTGMSQTGVIETALARYLDELTRESRRERADEILADMHRRYAALGKSKRMQVEDLYDEAGLPA